ncbi:hypothetical protein JXB41_07960 [Candidatus Woesearchaeota archaeon]|nr:hypothetical protein [Candidatus Woesearchaeota archaeon]
MAEFNKQEYDNFLMENNVVGFFDKPITLKSGRISNWYANCRDLQNFLKPIEKLTDFILAYIREKNIEFDYFYAVPDGVTKLGAILNYKKGKSDNNEKMPIVIGRKTPKEHGAPKDKYFIGPVNDGDKVIVLEDVTTTGGSLLTSIAQLKEAGVNIVAALGLVNRMEKRDDGKSVKEKVEENGFPYYNLSDAFSLLPKAAEKANISEEVKKDVESYFDKYGVEKFKF